MGFPANAVEGMYRNNLEDVAALLKKKHNGKFMIWNLSEREYDYAKMENQVCFKAVHVHLFFLIAISGA